MKLLHIDSSILGANSVSRQITAAVVDRIRHSQPHLNVTYRDLAAAPLAHLTPVQLPDGHPLAAPDAAAQAGKVSSQAALDEFLAADVVVIGAPMYNFTIPTQLKTWIDRIIAPGKTFQYTAEGVVKGLAGDKRVIVVVSRGGFYGPQTPSAGAEHAESYLRVVFNFIGVSNPEFIVAEGTQAGLEQRQSSVNIALQIATGLRAA